VTHGPAPEATPAPTLAAVRLARAQRDLMVRRLRPSGLIVLGLVLVIGSRKAPVPGLHGDHLGVLAALAATGVGGVAALLLPAEPSRVLTAAGRRMVVPGWALIVPFALLVAGSAGLVWLQPGGPGGLGAWVATAAALRVLPGRRSRLVGTICVVIISLAVVLGAAATHHGGRLPDDAVVLIALIPGLGCAVILFTRRLDRDSYQIERLLIELEQAQNAEVKAAALAERQRLAREMHDVLAHSLSGLALQLEGARLLAAGDPSDPRLGDAIDRAHHLAKSGLLEARRAIGMLRDDELPGPERLAALVAGFERDSGVHCELTVTGDPRVLGPHPQARLTVYRAAQEALTNIRKHAEAARAEVRLRYEPEGIRLTVEDFGPERHPVPAVAVTALAGRGNGDQRLGDSRQPDLAGDGGSGGEPGDSDDGQAAPGYGLAGMRERAELLGGGLTTARSATGFRVELWIPS
jgi:signal transduction histidine kinase